MRILALSLLIAFFATSCQPDLSDERPRAQVYTSLQDFQTKNKVAPQTFTANSSTTISVQGSKGSRFVFPASAFVTQNNQPVTGDVSIEVKEILTPKDMILSNMPTVSDGKPLESGGQFFIRVTKNNEELKLAPGKQVKVSVRNANTQAMQGMQVFNGVVAANGTVNWQANTNQANVVRPDSTGSTLYTMFSDQVNWLNIDKFYNEPQITYTVNVTNTPDINETVVYVHLTGRNTAFGFPRTAAGFTSDYIIAAPATLVAMCVKDKKLYYAMTPVTLQDRGTTNMQLIETTEENLKAKLATLH